MADASADSGIAVAAAIGWDRTSRDADGLEGVRRFSRLLACRPAVNYPDRPCAPCHQRFRGHQIGSYRERLVDWVGGSSFDAAMAPQRS